MSIIDTPYNTTSKLDRLSAQGVTTIIRYYCVTNGASLPEKRLERPEAQAIAAHGMQIAAVFQQRQDRAADFSEEKGRAAGQFAYRHARDNIHQPAGSAIYFAVDFDANNNEIASNIVPYFRGVKRAFVEESGDSPIYKIGAYGSGAVCGALARNGLSDFTWLAMSRGFRGTREALQRGEYHLAQRAPSAVLCGLDVDFDDPNPARPDFGAFTLAQGPSPIGERYKVTSSSGLRLREGPGTNFKIVGDLNRGQIVFVPSVKNGWAQVDVNGDGRAEGFASARYLQHL